MAPLSMTLIDLEGHFRHLSMLTAVITMMKLFHMTLSNLQRHSPIACVLKCYFSYSLAALTRFRLTQCRAVPLLQPSLLVY